MNSSAEEFLLQNLTRPSRMARGAETVLKAALLFSIVLFIGLGIALQKTPFSLESPISMARKIKVTVALDELKQSAKKRLPTPVKKPPVDLTKPATLKTTEPADVVKVLKKEEVRPVYGLRRVFAVGLGGGDAGAGADGIVSKLGNTLDKDIDTLTATMTDLKGEAPKGPVTAVTTVTQKPELLSAAKPEYTDEMKRNGVVGVVSARILVDIDGKVKQVEVLNDLGFGTRTAVEDACRKLIFKPALEGLAPVATWIIFKFRFVLQE